MSQTDSLVKKYPLKKVKIIKKTIGVVVGFFVITIFVLLFLFIAAMGLLGGLIASLILLMAVAGISFIYESIYYKNYFYDLTEDGLVIGKGVISSWRITVPKHKVQEIYLDQDLFDRIFGLYDLHLSTATDVSGREAHIDGLGKADAENLRKILFEWIGGVKEKPADAKPSEVFRPKLGSILIQNTFSWGIVLFLVFPPLIILLPLVLLALYLDYTVTRYELRKDGVFIRTGFFIPKESTYLYRNIQDVSDDQTIFDRVLGVHTLSVKTMTGASAIGAKLKYLLKSDALKLRNMVLEKSRNAVAAAELKATPNIKTAKPIAKIPHMEMPYKNEFMHSAKYATLLGFATWAIIGIVVFVFISLLFSIWIGAGAILVCIGFAIVRAIAAYINASISEMSYRYAITPDFVQITIKFLAFTKKQIPFGKIQDIEKHISFSDSFAKLANIKLETGSKEYLSKGNSTISGVTENEMINSLKDKDAESLKELIAKAIGVSLDGIGINPLVAQIPLDKRKPLKKTLWWVIYLGGALIILTALTLLVPKTFGLLFLVVAAILSAIAIVAKYRYELEYYKKYYYDLNQDVLVIRKGVFGSRELTVPLNRIQDVFIDRDLLDLVFGLYDVYISTATSRSILNAHIDGLDKKNTEKTSLLLINSIAKVN
ncbi:MAG: PH domain-containing protein [Candidatus Micrarchaeota archaeon]